MLLRSVFSFSMEEEALSVALVFHLKFTSMFLNIISVLNFMLLFRGRQSIFKLQ